MRKIFILPLLIFSVSIATAWEDSDDSYYGDEPYDKYGNPNYRYEGISGQRYQYDLSNPSDQIRYEVDPGAQLRDEINPSPRIELDRDMDQYGGGAEW